MITIRNKKGKRSKLFYFVWSAPLIGSACVLMLLGYITYFSTDVLGLPSGLVGLLLLLSKIFDGVTDILAGYLIDRTNTKWGKARPYDITFAFYAVATLILFSIPNIGTVGTAILVFTLYTMVFSIFQTLYSCAGTVYLARAVTDKEDQVSVGALTGMISAFASVVLGVLLPLLIDNIGKTASGWRMIAAVICIPSIALSFIRIFLIPEVDCSAETAIQSKPKKLTILQSAKLLFGNRYLMFFGLALLLTNIASNITANSQTYYFKYIVGDISMMSFVSVTSIIGPLTIAFYPMLSKKFGMKNLMAAALFIGAVGKLLPLLGLTSMPLLLISALFFSVSFMPIFILASNVIINCMDYGEYKNGVRGEGIYTCVSGFCSKVGTGLASGMLGLVTALGGYDGTAAVQSSSAMNSIILLFTVVPAALYLLAVIVLQAYKLDKELPFIQQELVNRKMSHLE